MTREKSSSLLICALLATIAGCAAPTFDNAYKQALVYGNMSREGVILFLHGCDGHFRGHLWPWQQEWANYFTSQDFLIVAPDSFADLRPPQSCGPPWSWKSEIYDLRIHQTKHALQQLRLKYPGAKIFVWGHSEGAGVANLLDEKVDGIMTTGYQCGFRTTSRTEVRPEVSFLALMGTADPFLQDIPRLTGTSSLRELCEGVFRSPGWRFVIVEGMKHSAPISVQEVKEHIDKFFGLESR